MAFTEFYCDAAGGSNINAGDKTANGVVTSANGGWSTITNIFTATGGTPFSGVSVGDFASLYLDGGTVSVYVARITNVGLGGLTLTLDTTAISGTAPTTAATGVSCTTGGSWKGPNGSVGFPFNFITAATTNVAGDTPRVNFKNGTTYAITAAMTQGKNGPIRFEGMTTTPGDGGKATFDGGTSGASYVPLTASASSNCDYVNLIIKNNGATGNANGFVISVGTRNYIIGCCVNNILGVGFSVSSGGCILAECEAYACNGSNTAAFGGFSLTSAGIALVRCISHDNVGSNSSGFVVTSNAIMSNCIADTNGQHGFSLTSTVGSSVFNCDAFNNTGDGISLGNATSGGFLIQNTNLVKNGGWGVNGSGAGARNGVVSNCGFGSGTQANTSGTTTGLKSMVESGSITYASNVTPWADPANGDFRINLATAIGAGRGIFTETAAGYAGTVGAPVIGAAQVANYPAANTVLNGTSYGNGAFTGNATGVPVPNNWRLARVRR